MPVEISEASAADAEEVSALAIKTYVDTFGAEFEPDELAHHLDLTISAARWREHFARDRVLVARLGGRAIGYVHFGPAGETGDVAIHRLYVTAELQGQKIGSQLLSRALAEPEVAAAPAVRIDVWEHNHDARRLYERFGFRHEGGMEPFVLKSGEIDGYDVVLIRRPPPALALSDGRSAFGAVSAIYDDARPRYPDGVFELLRDRCRLGPGTRAFEVGAGTGLATRPLLATGVNSLVAVEPDARLAAGLRDRTASDRLQIVVAPFEDADLAEGGFDLGCAATAFHWVEQRPALAKVARLLKSGGRWAMWWNVFGDPDLPDPFHDATRSLLAPLGSNPSHPNGPKQHFALDRAARLADLESVSSFEDVQFELLRWTLVFDPEQVRALYATFSHIAVLAEGERERILDGLHDMAATTFGGRIERHMLTPIYTCRRR
jgi:ribosomal protein S18 acetylase RimI-like enzyme/SAM-dependent methyltransferase